MNERLKLRLGVIAVALIFIINGGISQSIPPRYAEISAALGLSPGALGLALVGQTVGLALMGIILSLGLGERFGSRFSYGVPLVLFCLSPALIAIAHSGRSLFATQLFEGVTNAPIDLAQTTLALSLSMQLRKTLLPRFEVGFSAGSLLGAGAGAWAAGRIGLTPYLVGTTVLALAMGFVAWRFMPTAAEPEVKEGQVTTPTTPSRGNRGMWALALLAFFALLAEFIGQDWASVFYRNELHAAPTEYGYGGFAFQVGFVLILLVGGWLAGRFGGARVVRVGGVVFAAAMGLFVLSRSVPVATGALFVAGLGAGNLVPLVISGIEGHPRYKLWVARVTAVMYLGPGVSKLVGLLAGVTSLRVALAGGVVIGIVVAALAPVLGPKRSEAESEVQR